MIVIGIDEAGYGPLLGPLVVAGSAFRVEDGTDGAAFASRMRAALRRASLGVGDSKRLFGGTRDLATLERPLLSFLGTTRPAPSRLDDLLTAVGTDPASRRSTPWYAGELAAYPFRAAKDDLPPLAERLRAALSAQGIEFVGLTADVVPEVQLNDAFRHVNKADALFTITAGVFERLASARRLAEPLDAVFDRHGGRHYYSVLLQRRWPQTLALCLGESPRRSDYRLHFPDAEVRMRFEVEADGRHAHVGLASMLAKYLRELFMELFNGHFGRLCPGVAPTAGYRQDARRWLDETRAPRAGAGIPDSALVRLR